MDVDKWGWDEGNIEWMSMNGIDKKEKCITHPSSLSVSHFDPFIFKKLHLKPLRLNGNAQKSSKSLKLTEIESKILILTL